MPEMVCRAFYFKGTPYPYFYHLYNDTANSERCVEIPLALEMMNSYAGKPILEVGNVLRNYFKTTHDIIDKNPDETGAIHQDILFFKPDKKYDLIISISTLEHVGITDGPNSDKLQLVLDKFKEMLNPGGTIWATMPLGYNPAITRKVKQNIPIFQEEYFMKRVNLENDWVEIARTELGNVKYGVPFPWGCFLMIGASKI